MFKSFGKASKVTTKKLGIYIKIMQAHLVFKDNQYFINQIVGKHFWFKVIKKG